jgi:copper(I)-binding protein
MPATSPTRLGRAATALALLALPLAACTAAEEQQTTEEQGPVAALTMSDGWVEAAGQGDDTPAYGVFENSSDGPVTIAGASTDAARDVQLYQSAQSASGELVAEPAGVFEVPANGSLELVPGGNHFLLQDLTGPIGEGDEVTITLTTGEGRTAEVVLTGAAPGDTSATP